MKQTVRRDARRRDESRRGGEKHLAFTIMAMTAARLVNKSLASPGL